MSRIKERTLIQYILCYILILTTGATLWTHVLVGIRFKAIVVLVIDILIIYKYRIRIPLSFAVYGTMTVFCLLFLTYYTDGGLLGGDDLNATISLVIYALTAIVIYKLDSINAAKVYIRITYFFAEISLVFFLIQTVLGPSAFSEIIFRNANYRSEYGFLLYTICKQNLTRNYGIFYEPGVYQVVLLIALFLLLFNDNTHISKKKQRKYLVVLSITMLTTGSTTGYISFAILYSFLVLGSKGSKRIKTLFIVVLVVGGLGFDYIVNRTDSILFMYVINKFTEIGWNRNSGYYRYGTSGGARVFIIDIALQILVSHPLTGIGSNAFFSNYLRGTVWESLGTGNILCITIAKRGITFTILVLSYFLVRAFYNRKNIYSFLAFVLLLFNTVIAQSQLIYGVFALASFMVLGSERRANEIPLYSERQRRPYKRFI